MSAKEDDQYISWLLRGVVEWLIGYVAGSPKQPSAGSLGRRHWSKSHPPNQPSPLPTRIRIPPSPSKSVVYHLNGARISQYYSYGRPFLVCIMRANEDDKYISRLLRGVAGRLIGYLVGETSASAKGDVYSWR